MSIEEESNKISNLLADYHNIVFYDQLKYLLSTAMRTKQLYEQEHSKNFHVLIQSIRKMLKQLEISMLHLAQESLTSILFKISLRWREFQVKKPSGQPCDIENIELTAPVEAKPIREIVFNCVNCT